MPITKEFTIRLQDRPGTLGKLCQSLAEQNVNILAFHSCSLEKGKSVATWEEKTATSTVTADCATAWLGSSLHVKGEITVNEDLQIASRTSPSTDPSIGGS